MTTKNTWPSTSLQSAYNNAWDPHFPVHGMLRSYNNYNRPGPVYRRDMTSRNAFAAAQPYPRPAQRRMPPQAAFGRMAGQPGRLPSLSGGLRSAQRHFQGSAAPAIVKPPAGPRPDQRPGAQAPDARLLD